MSRNECNSDWRNPEEYANAFFFEKRSNYLETNRWSIEMFPKVVMLTFIYVVSIHAGQRYMKNRPAFQLRTVLLLWNVLLGLYSILAFVRVFGEMGSLFIKHGFHSTVCDTYNVEHRNLIAFWTKTFACSKILELGDTAFIVLRKTPLIFLHWYHHVATLLFVWYSGMNMTAMGRWFQVINLFVHAIMYSYYATKVLGVKVPAKVSMAITSFQLLQMAVGIMVTVYAYRTKLQGESCCVDLNSIFFAWVMYLSYFLLFLNFFIKTYFSKKRGVKTSVKELNHKKAM